MVFGENSRRFGSTPMLIMKTILIQLTALTNQMNQIHMHILNSPLQPAKYHLRNVSYIKSIISDSMKNILKRYRTVIMG